MLLLERLPCSERVYKGFLGVLVSLVILESKVFALPTCVYF